MSESAEEPVEQAVETSEEEEPPSLDSFPQVGFCADCYEPQYKTPHGETCKNGHGGAPTLDEVPKCESCEAGLKPKAKFCGECGESTEPKPEEPEEKADLCFDCGAELSPTAKFCGECGAKVGEVKVETSAMPRDMEEEQMRDEGATEEEIAEVLGPAPESENKTSKVKMPAKAEEPEKKSKVKMPVPKEEKKPEKTVKVPEKENEGEEEPASEEPFDFSTVNPETDWECFGMIEPEHSECKACPYKVKCAEKAGVEL